MAIADIDYTGAQQVAAELNRDGGQAIAVGMDVTAEAQVDDGMIRVCEFSLKMSFFALRMS
jgi:hypothetical protein